MRPRPAVPALECPEVLLATLRGPVNPYEVKAGTIIPAVLLTDINSDLPGQLTGRGANPSSTPRRASTC